MNTAMHLYEFSTENYRSVKEVATLSMMATPLHDKSATFRSDVTRDELLNCSVIFGANASGKSNVIRALFTYRNLIVGDLSVSGAESNQPFLLDDASKHADSVFEATFEYKEKLFQYGFSIKTSTRGVSGEWLRVRDASSKKLSSIFERDSNGIKITSNLPVESHGFSRRLRSQLQEQELFVTTISKNAAWSLAKDVIGAWKNTFVLNTLAHDHSQYVAKRISEDENTKDAVLSLLQQADLSISDIKVERGDGDSYKILLRHTYATEKSVKSAWFDMLNQESAGTYKFFGFALALLISLQRGTLMVLDELGSTLHPDLLKFVITMFNDNEINKTHAQLVLTTHDTSLLKGLFARDQVYFTAKDNRQVTSLYALSDIKGVRKDLSNLDEKYLEGNFGGVPKIVRE